MPCGLEKAGVKCKHLRSQKKKEPAWWLYRYVILVSLLVSIINTALTLYICCKLQHRVVRSHFLLYRLSFSIEEYRYFLNKVDYSRQLRTIKSIKPSFLELRYSSYYSPRHFPHQRYNRALFDYKSPLANQLKFKIFLNITSPDHVQLQQVVCNALRIQG